MLRGEVRCQLVEPHMAGTLTGVLHRSIVRESKTKPAFSELPLKVQWTGRNIAEGSA
jgi:hypothetical protein